MSRNSLIIGMGFGGLYKKVLTELGHNVVTVDPDPGKGADYATFDLVPKDIMFDTANICTPNYTHERIARMVATRCRIVCIEKPGVENAAEWAKLCADFPGTRFMMTKNNQWRDNINTLKELYGTSKAVNFNWINHNRVPNAGTWFTTRRLAYGGVSRDLLPHLLSLYIAVEPQWQDTKWEVREAKQCWQLKDLTTTDYGTVNPNGIYDVDDYVRLSTPGVQFTADWKGNAGDDIGIHFDGTFIELGLCPESAYKRMMETAINNVAIDLFWKDQYRQDMWIHSTIAV
jgi:hypothetical protein